MLTSGDLKVNHVIKNAVVLACYENRYSYFLLIDKITVDLRSFDGVSKNSLGIMELAVLLITQFG